MRSLVQKRIALQQALLCIIAVLVKRGLYDRGLTKLQPLSTLSKVVWSSSSEATLKQPQLGKKDGVLIEQKRPCSDDPNGRPVYYDIRTKKQADKAISSIKPGHIQEVKKLPNPADVIKMVFDCILLLFHLPVRFSHPQTVHDERSLLLGSSVSCSSLACCSYIVSNSPSL